MRITQSHGREGSHPQRNRTWSHHDPPRGGFERPLRTTGGRRNGHSLNPPTPGLRIPTPNPTQAESEQTFAKTPQAPQSGEPHSCPGAAPCHGGENLAAELCVETRLRLLALTQRLRTEGPDSRLPLRLRHRIACDGLLIRFHVSSITHPRAKDCATQSEEAPGIRRGPLVDRLAFTPRARTMPPCLAMLLFIQPKRTSKACLGVRGMFVTRSKSTRPSRKPILSNLSSCLHRHRQS